RLSVELAADASIRWVVLRGLLGSGISSAKLRATDSAGAVEEVELTLEQSAWPMDNPFSVFYPDDGTLTLETPRFLRIELPTPTRAARHFELEADGEIEQLAEISLFE